MVSAYACLHDNTAVPEDCCHLQQQHLLFECTLNFLEKMNPFTNDPTLYTALQLGYLQPAEQVSAADNVNVDSVKAVCVKVLLSMVDTNAFEYSFN